MFNLKEILARDSEQIFADWGESAMLMEIQQRYDVESGGVSETTFAAPLRVIRGEDRPQLVGEVSATLSLTRRLMVVRAVELPQRVPLETARIVLDDIAYEIRSVRESNQSGLLVLECVCNDLKE